MADDKGKMIKLTGLWLKEKDGRKWFEGALGMCKVFVMRNTFKKEDKHPDYYLLAAPREPKRQRSGNGGNRQGDDGGAPF